MRYFSSIFLEMRMILKKIYSLKYEIKMNLDMLRDINWINLKEWFFNKDWTQNYVIEIEDTKIKYLNQNIEDESPYYSINFEKLSYFIYKSI